MPSRGSLRNGSPRGSLWTWSQRALLAALVAGVLVFGLRANGLVANEVSTIDESVWLLDPPAGVVVRVNAVAEDVTSVVKVAEKRQQLTAAQLGSGAVVLNRSTSALGRVDGTTLAYERGATRTTVGADLALHGNDAGVFAVDTSAGRIIALDAADLSTRYETPITAQQKVPAVVDLEGRLWAYDATMGEVIRFDGRSGDVRRSVINAPGVQAEVALVRDRPVLVEAASGEAVRLKGDGSAGQRGCLGGTSSGGLFVAGTPAEATEARLFTLSTETGHLWTSDIEQNRCVSLQLGDEFEANTSDGFGQPVVHAERLYVPVLARSQVLVVNAADNSIERTIDLRFVIAEGHRFELFVDGGRLWFNDLEGSQAGVLSRLGPTLVIDKVLQRSYSGENLGEDEAGRGATEARGSAGRGDLELDLGVPIVAGGRVSFDGDVASAPSTNGVRPGVGGSPRAGGSTSSGEGVLEGGVTSLAPVNTIPAFVGPAAIGAGPEKKPTPAAQPSATDSLLANFTYSPPGDPTTETQLSFVDTSAGKIQRWVWAFTAPNAATSSASGRTASRSLAQVGLWTVTLSVTDSSGRTDTTRPVPIQVRDPADLGPPNANFTWDPATPVLREPVLFKDRSTSGRNSPITNWFWEFGDGTTANVANPGAKTYAAPGTYAVRLTVTNKEGVDAIEASLTVAVAASTLDPDFDYVMTGTGSTSIVAGQTVIFTDTTTGGPTGWTWDFGDGLSSNSPIVGHVFRVSGEFRVRLTVSNARGNGAITKIVRVGPPVAAPQARIAEPVANTVVEVGKPVRFVSGSTGNPTHLVWDWGDGTKGEGASASKTFTTPGAVAVRLTAANAVGSTAAVVVVSVVDEAPPVLIPGFTTTTGTSATDLAVVGEAVRFVNSSTGVGTFAWAFGDGSVSTERDPDYAFKKVGTYHVTLTMTQGAFSVVAEGVVYVGPALVPVVANFDFTPKAPTLATPVVFVDRTSGSPLRWSWNFGDASPAFVGQNPPPKLYAAAGRYDVTLTVVDRGGVVTTKTLVVTVQAAVKPPPLAAFSVTPAAVDLHVAGRALVFADTTVGAGAALTTPVFTIEGNPVSPPAGSRSVEHIFATARTYPVNMRVCWVEDPTNCDNEIKSLVITDAVTMPAAAFTVSGAGVVPGGTTVLLTGLPIVFQSTTTGGAPMTLSWTVGTQVATGETVQVVLSAAGPLTVTLTASNSAGDHTARLDFQVYAAPTAAFTAPTSALVGTSVRFNDTSIPALATRSWDFGDGTGPVAGTADGVDHVFATPGDRTVTLTVNLNGRVAAVSKVIRILPGQPAPQIQAINLSSGTPVVAPSIAVAVGDTVVFTDIGAGPTVESRAWSWSDAAPAGAGPAVQRTFGANGTYILSLVATNASGGTTVTMTIVVGTGVAGSGVAGPAVGP